ncbi:hypothetical protein DS745_23160 [Anaerobacillus alkaliphilus]|uniref:Uncharacterized protein n=1 Tax=Anaerobacillus alkaliphilus TaxID=1548597 RepID=A0A4Q0VP19_9BACI|nr:hypothetical protein [Anaerobacillus alkaliphilus]RXI96602.1 hypothetical protein DS745_23160 [Anaerobacillus alkaliphilus]
MELTELGWGIFLYVTLAIFVVCLFDYPKRRGRDWFERYEGVYGTMLSIYTIFFFVIAVATAAMVATLSGMFISMFGPFNGFIVGMIVFFLFISITVSLVEHRSKNEMFLLKLKAKFPHFTERDQR